MKRIEPLFCSVENAPLQGKRVLMRVDVNVPLTADGRVADHERIVQILPTINYILSQGAKQLILISHHGRPHGVHDSKHSLYNVAMYLRDVLAYNIHFVPTCTPDHLPERKLIMLENVRFDLREEQNDAAFAQELARHADLFVNDAFGSYQPHASVASLPKYLPSYVGFLFEREIQRLSLADIERPCVFLLGGDKASTKLPMIKRIAEIADHVLIGGVLPFYFLAAQGKNVGKSKYSMEYVDEARPLIGHPHIHLPQDFVVAKTADADAQTTVRSWDAIRDDEMGLDIGPQTAAEYEKILRTAKTIIWNGPMGLCEVRPFATHTYKLANLLPTLDATVIAGGGDSISVINWLGIGKRFDHISTGGGAALEFLRTGTHPGLEAIKQTMLHKEEALTTEVHA